MYNTCMYTRTQAISTLQQLGMIEKEIVAWRSKTKAFFDRNVELTNQTKELKRKHAETEKQLKQLQLSVSASKDEGRHLQEESDKMEHHLRLLAQQRADESSRKKGAMVNSISHLQREYSDFENRIRELHMEHEQMLQVRCMMRRSATAHGC